MASPLKLSLKCKVLLACKNYVCIHEVEINGLIRDSWVPRPKRQFLQRTEPQSFHGCLIFGITV